MNNHFFFQFGRALTLLLTSAPYAELATSAAHEADTRDTMPMFFEKLLAEPHFLRALASEGADGSGFNVFFSMHFL